MEHVKLTCSTSQWDTPVSGTPHQNPDASSTKHTMPQQHNVQQLQKEGRLALSKQAIQSKQVSSYRKAAQLYDVHPSTIHRRVKGALPRAARNAQKRKLHQLEEQSLIQWILELDRRGFPPQTIDVRQMADHLLAARGQTPSPPPVGKNWVDRFMKASHSYKQSRIDNLTHRELCVRIWRQSTRVQARRGRTLVAWHLRRGYLELDNRDTSYDCAA